jgi:hypothetical protein
LDEHTQTDILDPVLSATLDHWEVEPVSLDFNRRLFQRIREFDEWSNLRWCVRYGPPVLLLLLILYATDSRGLSSRNAPHEKTILQTPGHD